MPRFRERLDEGRKSLEEGRRTFQPSLWLRLVVLGAIAVYLVLFVVLNAKRVHVRFVFATANVSLIWVILLSLLAGLIGGMLLSQLYRHRQRRR